MSHQGERHTGHEDDWWGQLYDDSTEDTGPTAAADTIEDRFASAAGTVGSAPSRPSAAPGETPDLRDPREPADEVWPPEDGAGWPEDGPGGRVAGRRRWRAPWEAPEGGPGPRTFPAEPKPASTGGPAAVPAARVPDEDPEPGRVQPPSMDVRLPRVPHQSPPREVSAAPPTVSVPPGSPDTGTTSAAAQPSGVAPAEPPPTVVHVGDGPPTYEAEPTALPPADPDDLDDLVADTVLDGARYGSCTLRAASVRGDSARFRGEPRRDCLLTARFGTGGNALVLVAMATGARATPDAHRAAAEACHWIGRAVGRSHLRLAEDIRAARRGDLKSGLHRLTDRSLGKLRASAVELGLQPDEYAATLRCLLLPADPECRTRVFFGVGGGGLFRLRGGEWQDIEPHVGETETTGAAVVGYGSPPSQTPADAPHETPDGDRLTMDLGITTPPSPYDTPPEPPHEPFRFRASVARPGDTLLLCTGGLAEPLRGEPRLAEHLRARWADGEPPGLAAFLADTQVRVKGYADDRTAAAVWEA
ncbi:protein phosphatase 2C domain-containing protein [Streptomyces sp. NPDC002896]|uniref:protein phosphatase 2C domain-containing protein n=1 Tax=Streptomyces sp. NPDC002896 TaxID=3154438 RepID=UPI00332DDE5F